MSKNGFLLVAIFYATYLVTIIFGLNYLNPFLKPLLLPALIALVYFSNFKKDRTLLLLALFFSTLGDIFLLSSKEIFFILGLGSFLTAHVLYIFIFKRAQNSIAPMVVNLVLLAVLLVYLCFFLNYLWPNLKEMKIPVVVYALTISTMLWTAVNNWFSNKCKANLIVVLGALFFVVSDSILAIDLFHHKIELGRFLVMSTYLAAQYFIVFGLDRKFVEHEK
jgi:uncharacterized membrane protein YhhN